MTPELWELALYLTGALGAGLVVRRENQRRAGVGCTGAIFVSVFWPVVVWVYLLGDVDSFLEGQ